LDIGAREVGDDGIVNLKWKAFAILRRPSYCINYISQRIKITDNKGLLLCFGFMMDLPLVFRRFGCGSCVGLQLSDIVMRPTCSSAFDLSPHSIQRL